MEFSKEDINNIEEAIKQGGDIWNSDLLKNVKAKIKDFCRARQGQKCCYCRRQMTGEFKMVIDIEHILPKSKYDKYMFKLVNLAASCKRCNMPMKREDDSFFIGQRDNDSTHFVSRNYQIIHPNLDTYSQHLEYLVNIVNEKVMIKYNVINDSEKGKYTYDYFKLMDLEVNSFSDVHGASVETPNRELIDDETAKKIEQLFE
jgi:uncharacterized protein (TIGR02646 family)